MSTITKKNAPKSPTRAVRDLEAEEAVLSQGRDPAEKRLHAIHVRSEEALFQARELLYRLAETLPEEIDVIPYAARAGAEAGPVADVKSTILDALGDLSKITQSLAATVGDAEAGEVQA